MQCFEVTALREKLKKLRSSLKTRIDGVQLLYLRYQNVILLPYEQFDKQAKCAPGKVAFKIHSANIPYSQYPPSLRTLTD